ncbi:putative transmembrane protein [Toxoplasma gondii p89]|uniref:Putative transmembrane protein n=1 Tax=Toxoplasma gondii p89 TaxID=943119 RepID=A0A086KEU0_TOXGO|nr:putative transmembrane protein [Toxoplasma gondii p89]
MDAQRSSRFQQVKASIIQLVYWCLLNATMVLPIFCVVVCMVIANNVAGMDAGDKIRPSGEGAGNKVTHSQSEPHFGGPHAIEAPLQAARKDDRKTSNEEIHKQSASDDTTHLELVRLRTEKKKQPGGVTPWLRRRWIYAAGVATAVLLGAYGFRQFRERRQRRDQEARTLAMAARYLQGRAEASRRIERELQKKERDASWFLPNARNAEIVSKGTPRHEKEKADKQALERIVEMLETQRMRVAKSEEELRAARSLLIRENPQLATISLTEQEEADAAERGRVTEARGFLNYYLPETEKLEDDLVPEMREFAGAALQAPRGTSERRKFLKKALSTAKERTSRRVWIYVSGVANDLPATVGVQASRLEERLGTSQELQPEYVAVAERKLDQLSEPEISHSDTQ